MTKKSLLVCLCLSVLMCGCQKEPPRKKEAWEKREQVYTDHPPEHWLELIQHRNPRVRDKAAPMVVQYGKSQVPPLVEILETTKSSGVRFSVVRALGSFGSEAADAVPALCKVLKDKDWSKRDVAAEALGKIRGDMERTIPALMEALKDEDTRVRGAVIRAFGRIGSGDRRIVSALATALEDEDMEVRAEAADALAAMGPEAKAAIAALEKAAKCEYFNVSMAAQEALRKIRGN